MFQVGELICKSIVRISIDLSILIATTAKDVLSRSGLSDDTLAKVW